MGPKLFHPEYFIRYLENSNVPVVGAILFKEVSLGQIENQEAMRRFAEFLDKNPGAIQPELVRVLTVANRESIHAGA